MIQMHAMFGTVLFVSSGFTPFMQQQISTINFSSCKCWSSHALHVQEASKKDFHYATWQCKPNGLGRMQLNLDVDL